MTKVNKTFLFFFGLILAFGISSITILQKLSPLALHTISYCKSMINSFSMPLSHYLGLIPFVMLFLFSTTAIVKLLLVLTKAKHLKKNLVKNISNSTSPERILTKLQLIERTHIIQDPKQFAFCLGIKNPKIYVSTGMIDLLSENELEIVLRHEKYHLDNKDTLTMLVASICESLLPFFPLISDLLNNYRIEREIRADTEAITGFGDTKPLLSVLKKLLNSTTVPMLTTASITDQGTLEPRILNLIEKEHQFKKFKLSNVFISMCSIFIMIAIALTPARAFEVDHSDQDAVQVCTEETCTNSCVEESYLRTLYPSDISNESAANTILPKLYTPVR